MDIDAVKRGWSEVCTTITKLTPDEAASLVQTVDDLIAEVERLTAEIIEFKDQSARRRTKSIDALLKLRKISAELEESV